MLQEKLHNHHVAAGQDCSSLAFIANDNQMRNSMRYTFAALPLETDALITLFNIGRLPFFPVKL